MWDIVRNRKEILKLYFKSAKLIWCFDMVVKLLDESYRLWVAAEELGFLVRGPSPEERDGVTERQS